MFFPFDPRPVDRPITDVYGYRVSLIVLVSKSVSLLTNLSLPLRVHGTKLYRAGRGLIRLLKFTTYLREG